MWTKLDDGWWHNHKVQALSRAARGLLADVLSYCGDAKKDGYIPTFALSQLRCSAQDADFRALIRAGLIHRSTDTCVCLTKRDFVWPGKGYVVHDWLDYNPSRDENEVERAKRAELRDSALRAAVRARDLSRCRYCARQLNPKARNGSDDVKETLDHVDPLIAAGADNLVLACKSCNSAKRNRTPEQALMPVIPLTEIRALHFAELGEPDPDLAPIQNEIQNEVADAPGRVGTGRAPLVIGPPTTRRDSSHPNPYTKGAHGDPALEPPPPEPITSTRPSPASKPTPGSRRPSNRKGRRRR